MPEDKIGEPVETHHPAHAETPSAGTAAAEPTSNDRTDDPRRKVLRAFVRPGRGQVIAAVILFVVALGGVMQVKSTDAGEAYESARQDDLVQILDGLNSESRRLTEEIEDLENTRESLRSGADRSRVARSEAQHRVDDLGILAGTVPAEGQGVRLTVTDPHDKLRPALMIEAVQELRDAGAEAIEINDEVRVVASTSFAGTAGAITADDVEVGTPVVIEAIGDSDSLASGASFRGGFVDQVAATAEGEVTISKRSKVTIESLHRS
jgi:uncharacterized protein YlxW (UPF0749 family)